MTHLVLVLTAFLLASCGSSQSLANNTTEIKTPGTETTDQAATNNGSNEQLTFSVIPYDLNDLVFPDKADEVKKETHTGNKKVVKSGFRVQIAAIQNFSESRKFLEDAKKQFEATEYEVHSEFYSPNFKISIGDFLQQEDAKAILPQIQAMGYKDAFVVRANIVVEE